MNWEGCGRKRSSSNFTALSQYLPGGTEEKDEKHQSGYPVSSPSLKHGTSQILSGSAKHSTTTFGDFEYHHHHHHWLYNSVRVLASLKSRLHYQGFFWVS
jgi:hypothetical protein